MTTVRIEAAAKVNLRLMVLARENTGFHSLETVFCGISLFDTIEVERTEGILRLDVEGEVDTGPNETNLALRAARLFYRRIGQDGGATIRLEKRIPAAAGLGGGSSDAAATLIALNSLHDQPLDTPSLRQLGADLGSDIPFFLTGTPYALAWGRGERLLELPPLPARPVLVAHPGISMPTADVFTTLAAIRERIPQPVRAFSLSWRELTSWAGVEALASNDLEEAVRDTLFVLTRAREILREAGARIALLAGSGSSIFGVFAKEESLAAAENELRRAGLSTWRATTLERWPQPVRTRIRD